ncbi:hypothetical protein ACFX11_035796 [Malus domestica]
MEMKINSGEGKQYCLKLKPGARGVVPAKRRSVKSLILEDFLQCFRSLLLGTTTSSTTPAPSAGILTNNGDTAKASSAKKIMIISNHSRPHAIAAESIATLPWTISSFVAFRRAEVYSAPLTATPPQLQNSP